MAKERSRLSSAKLDTDSFICEGVCVEINGEKYVYGDGDTLLRLIASIEAHIKNDKEFGEYITLTVSDGAAVSKKEELYAAALLCAFGYLGKEELFTLMTGTVCD